MSTSQVAGLLLVLGSVVFCVGAGIGVPRVHTEHDRQARLRMLQEGAVAWRVAQPFYLVGPLIVAAGVGVLATDVPSGAESALVAASAVLVLGGALAWARIVYLRTVDVPGFALGTLPPWPFVTYVWLTVGGLVLLGAGLVVGDLPAWLGWVTSVGAVGLLLLYLRTKDLPPFTFYLQFTLVGAVLLSR